MLDLSAAVGDRGAVMGGTLTARPAETITFTAMLAGADPAGLEVIQNGASIVPKISPTGAFEVRMGARDGWVRINVRDRSGRLLMIGNPIYLAIAHSGTTSRR